VTTSLLDRLLPSDGVFNLRDLGGYQAVDGRRTRWRTLFRADGLHRSAPAHPTIRGLGWRTVLDLRTLAERDLGAYACEGVDVVHLPVLRQTWDSTEDTVDGDAVSFLAARYLDMAEEGAAAIATAFEIIASPGRLPAVFHCSAGKDRTGVLAALVLATVGVEDRDIAADYALSGRAMAKLAGWLAVEHPDVMDGMAQQSAALLACPPDAILRFLRSLRARFGSTDGYLSSIGVNAEARESVREALLQP
jgi:protein-tyrosine phosphatase